MSILVDFYNLDLNLDNITASSWRTPEEDRKKIVEFFEKYAPKVLQYKTAKEILSLSAPVYAEAVGGTLGMYEQTQGKSWFDSEDANNFYYDYIRIHVLIDNYITKRKIPKSNLLIWISDFTKGFTPTLLIGNNKTKELYSLPMFPDAEIDLSKQAIIRGQSASGKWHLATAKLADDLYNDFVCLLEGKLEIRQCAAEDCGKIFIPSTDRKKEVYHDKKCYWRESKRRYRKKLSEK